MKVFIKDKRQRLFLTSDGGWTKQSASARDYCNTASAIAHCGKNLLYGAHICVQLDRPSRIFVLQFRKAAPVELQSARLAPTPLKIRKN